MQYPKAGTTNSSARIGVVSASGGPTTWMKMPGDPRNNYLARMDWAANPTELTIQQLNRRQTVNTMFIANAKSGAVRPLFVDRDSAWIDIYDDHNDWGPGPSLHWLDDGSAFVYLSERDGWRHAFLVSRDGTMRLITPGKYDVMKVSYIDTKGGWLYFYASPENATQMYLWRIRLDGRRAAAPHARDRRRERTTYDIGPDARFAHSHGVVVGHAAGHRPGAAARRTRSCARSSTITSLKSKLDATGAGPVEFAQVDIGDGVKLDGWIMKPANFDSTKKYPVLFYVYGEPADQTVATRTAAAAGCGICMLAQQGYIVASVDNRGTPGPRGRDWRKAVHNQIGVAARARSVGGGARHRTPAVRRLDARRRVGLERRRLDDAAAHVPRARRLQGGHGGRAGGRRAQLRHDLPGALRRTARRTDSAAYRDASAVNFARGLQAAICSSSTARATTTCTIRGRSS